MSRDLVIRIRADSGKAVDEVRRVTNEFGTLEDSIESVAQAAAAGKAGLADMEQAAATLEEAVAATGQAATTVAAYLGGALSVGAFVGKVIAVQREFDVLNAALITVTGSSAAAAKEFAWIKEFAASTPFDLAQVTEAFVKMKSFGLDASAASLTSYGNTAAAMGKSLSQAIEAVADASTGEFERLKEFGIKARIEGEQVKLTFQGVTTTIGNNAAEITRYLQGIGNIEFGGAMAERAKTLDGAISNLSDSWNGLFLTISQQNAGQLIHDSVTLASGAIGDAIDIIGAMNRATEENARQTGAAAAIQEGLAHTFETVAVLGTNLAYVLEGIGREIGGLAAQATMLAQLDFSAAAAIGDMMKADAEAARAAVDSQSEAILNARADAAEFRQVLDNARKGVADYNATVGRLVEMQNAGKISVQQFRTAVESLQPASKATSAAVEALARPARDVAKAVVKSAATTGDALRAVAEEADSSARAIAAWADSSISAAASQAASNAETTARMQEQLATLGMSAEALARYNATKLDAAAATEAHAAAELEAAAAILTAKDALPEVARAYRQMAQERRRAAEDLQRQAKLTLDISAGEAVIEQQRATEEAARSAAAEWQRTADSINQSITDALLRGFEDGAGFAENFRDTVVNMFKTLVLRPVIAAMVQPLAGGIASAVGGTAGGGMGGTLNTLSGVQSVYGALSGGLVSSVSGAIGSLGSTLGSTALTTFSAGMKGATLGAGMMGPTTSGAGGLLGAGAGFASALPWLAGGLAVASLLGAFDKKPSNRSAGGNVDLGTGETSGLWNMTGKKQAPQETLNARDALLMSGGIVGRSLGATGSMAVDIGGRDGFKMDLGDGMRSYGHDVNEALRAMYRDMLADTEGVSSEFRDVIASMVETAPAEIAGFVTMLEDNFSVMATSADVFGKVQTALHQGFSDLGVTMPASVADFKALATGLDLTTEAGRATYAGLVALAPAFLELQTQLDGLSASLMLPSERLSAAQAELAQQYEDLGVSVPGSVAALRDLVEAQDQNTEAGRVLRAQLLATAPAMLELEAALLDMAGISGDDIATTLRDAMLGRIDGDDAGGQIAQVVLDGMHNAIANTFAQSITDIMVGQVITPVIQAAVTGSSISAAVSQASIANMIAAANAAAAALNAILSDASFQASMQMISEGISSAVSAGTRNNSIYKPVRAGGGRSSGGGGSKSAADSAKDAWDAAYEALSKAANLQRDLAQEQLDTAQAVIDITRSAANELRGISDASVQMSALAGNQAISDALLALRNTGYLPDPEALGEAVEAARAGLERTSYGSAFEQQRAALVLAGKLSEIADLTEPQKSAAEKQIEYLDGLLATAKEQLEALKGNAVATLTLAQAVTQWSAQTGKALPQFAAGGFTGQGGKLDPAGVVHKGEIVWSQDDIARFGGVAAVEQLRTGRMPGYADGGIVAPVLAPWLDAGPRDDQQADIDELRRELAALRAALESIARTSHQTARILDRTTRGGEAMLTEVAT